MNQIILVFSNGFDWIWQTSVMAGIMIVLIFLVKWLLKGRLNIRWHYSLWLLLIIRLVLPWAPESPFSIYQFFSLKQNEAGAHMQSVSFMQLPDHNELIPLLPASSAGERVLETKAELGTQPQSIGVEQVHSSNWVFPPVYSALLFIWVIGTMGFAGFMLFHYLRFTRRMRGSWLVTDRELHIEFERCKNAMGIKSRIPLLFSDQVNSPALYGFVRPSLLIPVQMAHTLNTQQWTHVFLHELAHYKRKDIGINWIMSGLLVLHWFNPLLWLAFSRMREEQEQACDALALSYLGSDHSAPYGQTLLKLLENRVLSVHGSGITYFSSDKSRLYRRIGMIKGFSSGAYQWSTPGVAVLVLLAVLSLTNAGSGHNGLPTEPVRTALPMIDKQDQQKKQEDQDHLQQQDETTPMNEAETEPTLFVLPSMEEAGVVRFYNNESKVEIRLPLIAIAAKYGVDYPDPPAVAPTQALPVISFSIPADQQKRLAVYWVSTSVNGDQGILLLGPRGWKAESAEIGANGSIYIGLVNPDDPEERISYDDTAGGCQGCAISSIGTYFPSLREWADSFDFPGTPVEFTWQKELSVNVMAYAKAHERAGYETNGAAFQEHEEGAWFRKMEMSHTQEHHSLATTLLNFFIALYGQPPTEMTLKAVESFS